MTQPSRYDRAFSFTNHSANLPTVPQPGVSLDAEFEAVEVTTDEIIDNLGLIQRDDGALANGIVGPDQLSSEITLGLRSISDWMPLTGFIAADAVWTSNKLYRCLTSHTSAPSFATDLGAGRWQLLVDMAPYAAAAAAIAVTEEVLAGIELDVDLGPINTALAGKASLADANVLAGLNTFNLLVTALSGVLASVNTAVTQADYFQAKPTDYGAGKPGLFIRKKTAAGTWAIVLDDGLGGTTTLDLGATNVTKNGSALLTAADIDNTALQTASRRNKVFALSALNAV